MCPATVSPKVGARSRRGACRFKRQSSMQRTCRFMRSYGTLTLSGLFYRSRFSAFIESCYDAVCTVVGWVGGICIWARRHLAAWCFNTYACACYCCAFARHWYQAFCLMITPQATMARSIDAWVDTVAATTVSVPQPFRSLGDLDWDYPAPHHHAG